MLITYWSRLDVFLMTLRESDKGLNITLQCKIYLTAVEMLLAFQKYLWLRPILPLATTTWPLHSVFRVHI